ncbi:HEAT repeat domain-containing protein [Rubripirellula sp.]|nr:HEAT repeat domain-containing protein [Rubripirellula sp.]MDB4633788.1 HEAT repeat domain-containing protein [Rubripirellula sp.]MDB4807779.1 HEAT repeat domain-containing protein [bacterium]MDC0288753.1 HEAT repeat domain-containing protein [Rubripirellula sp.]
MSNRLFFIVAVAGVLGIHALGSVGPSVLADTVEISGGGHLTGEASRKPDSVIVRVDDEIHVALPASRVRRVVDSDQLSAYRAWATKAGDDAELHYQLAVWCVTGSNVPGDSKYYRAHHLQRAITLDPEHAKARAGLGFKKQNGKWVRTSDLMRGRGMISRAGRWELPESVAIEDYQQDTDVNAKKWIKEVKRLVALVLRNTKKSPEALAALQAIEDPLASSAIADQLNGSRDRGNQSRDLRMLWIRLLGKFRDSVSVQNLVQAGLIEDDNVIREAALEQLVKYGAGSAVASYLPCLTKNDNPLVNRAAFALSWFPDPELAMNYVDALVTTHETEQAPNSGINAGFGDGGGGLQTGGKKKVYVQTRKNPAVLALLQAIEPEVDYGYDEQRWREHFANKRSSFNGDLRRDL